MIALPWGLKMKSENCRVAASCLVDLIIGSIGIREPLGRQSVIRPPGRHSLLGSTSDTEQRGKCQNRDWVAQQFLKRGLGTRDLDF